MMQQKKQSFWSNMGHRFISLLCGFLGLVFVLLLVFIAQIRIPTPVPTETISLHDLTRVTVGENEYRVNNSWLKKNDAGIWEMYLEGSPYERGLTYGLLSAELMEYQEATFVNQINELVPNSTLQQFLQLFIAWFNRDLYTYVPAEILTEIYGVSKSFSDKYQHVGPKFYRILYYHGAHDIGHALSDLNMVGCTSFAVKGDYSENKELLIGRNLDFYMGEDFAKEKLLLFLKPDSGYAFSSYSWAGLMGVISGMNEKGLAVTINASQSDVPSKAKEPISILVREILQYAQNIEEAIAIVQNRNTFVSESIMIGSAQDGKAIIIEKSPTKMGVFEVDTNVLICANHYQSDAFIDDDVNKENIKLSDSNARFKRMQDLLKQNKPLNPTKTAAILRDKLGAGGKDIGFGNSKSLNQLIAHHAVIFEPSNKQMWVSTGPYQLGAFLKYNLDSIFNHQQTMQNMGVEDIPADTFANSDAFTQYQQYKKQKEVILKSIALDWELNLQATEIDAFIALNSNSYEVYAILGKYYAWKNEKTNAIDMYTKALSKEVASEKEAQTFRQAIAQLNKQ